eukprot:1190666-Amphidinium_carterae.1
MQIISGNLAGVYISLFQAGFHPPDVLARNYGVESSFLKVPVASFGSSPSGLETLASFDDVAAIANNLMKFLHSSNSRTTATHRLSMSTLAQGTSPGAVTGGR